MAKRNFKTDPMGKSEGGFLDGVATKALNTLLAAAVWEDANNVGLDEQGNWTKFGPGEYAFRAVLSSLDERLLNRLGITIYYE